MSTCVFRGSTINIGINLANSYQSHTKTSETRSFASYKLLIYLLTYQGCYLGPVQVLPYSVPEGSSLPWTSLNITLNVTSTSTVSKQNNILPFSLIHQLLAPQFELLLTFQSAFISKKYYYYYYYYYCCYVKLTVSRVLSQTAISSYIAAIVACFAIKQSINMCHADCQWKMWFMFTIETLLHCT